MNYPESVQYLYALGNEMRSARLGLDRMHVLLAALGSPHGGRRFVHVAGTNGKGSTCAMIESALRTAGLRTGLFTSPHLVEPTERIAVAGEPVSSNDFAGAFDLVHAASEDLLRRGAIDAHPSYFETVTAMAFLLFAERSVDIAVMEVGLGGRLDATNVIAPELCVITSVDYDHQSWLGSTIEAIAGEKAGIQKPGVPAVIAAQRHPEAERILLRHQPVFAARDYPVSDVRAGATGSSFGAHGLEIRCPLPGAHQVDNATAAVMALEMLGIPPRAIEAGLAATRWPGRLQTVSRRPEIVLDGAHNPAGATALAGYIREQYRGRRVRLVYAAMNDKAVAEMTAALLPLAAEVIVTKPDNPRAMDPAAVLALIRHPNARAVPRVPEALAAIPHDDSATFVTGSLYLVGEAYRILVK